MEPETLSKLPFAFQVVVGTGLFIGSVGFMAFGWFKKNLFPDGLAGERHETKDAVVLTAAFADSTAIAGLATAIKDLVEFLREEAENDHSESRRNREVLCDIRDGIERLDRHVKDKTLL